MTSIYAICGAVVLAESLRRLEYARVSRFKTLGRCWTSQMLGVAAWFLLAFVSACATFAPLLSVSDCATFSPLVCWGTWKLYSVPPSISEVLALGGAAGVVVREWLERLR